MIWCKLDGNEIKYSFSYLGNLPGRLFGLSVWLETLPIWQLHTTVLQKCWSNACWQRERGRGREGKRERNGSSGPVVCGRKDNELVL